MNKKALRAEIIKCGNDPEYFIRKYIMIEHPVRGLIPFDLFDYQEHLLRDYENERFNIVLKARQLGISEVTAAYSLWLMLFRRNKNIVVIATKKDTAKNIIRKISVGIKNLPKWIMLTSVKTDNVYSIEFTNGSRIKALSTAKDAGRSEAGSLMIIDEAAHIDNMDEIWTGLRPVVTAGGNVIVLSTPNGVGNMFHDEYLMATKKESLFKPTKLMWWVHPEHIDGLVDDPSRPGFKTSPWFRNETKGMNSRKIAQEYECNFNASGDTYIQSEFIRWMDENTIIPPISFECWDRNLHIWNRPDPGKQYLLTADVARGDGNDNSAAVVFDSHTMTQVAEYYAKVPPDQFAEIVCKMGEEYNDALMVIENNSIGLACLEHVKIREYPNLYFSMKGDFKPGKAFNCALPLPPITEYIPGFTTSHKTRPLILQKLEEYIRTRSVTIRSERATDEFKKFIWNNGKPMAQKGYNDDLTISIALGCYIKEVFLSPGFMSEDISRKMLDMTTLIKHENIEIPGATKDPRWVRKNENYARRPQNPYELRLPNGGIEDLGWLIVRK